LEVTYAEYQARCRCHKYFRTWPLDVPPKADYDAAVRQAVLDRLVRDRLNVEQTKAAMRRDFLVQLSDGFVYDCLRWQLTRLDLAEHRQLVLRRFSGTLCVDELYLGTHTLPLATDPLADLPVGFAVVGANDQDHMGRFLRHLARWGLQPEVVVSDGSGLYRSCWPRFGPTPGTSCASSTCCARCWRRCWMRYGVCAGRKRAGGGRAASGSGSDGGNVGLAPRGRRLSSGSTASWSSSGQPG
jgi:hypothetical protein